MSCLLLVFSFDPKMTLITTRDHIVLTVSDESVEQEFIRLVLVLVLHHNIVVDPGDLVGVVIVGDVSVGALELHLVSPFLGECSSNWQLDFSFTNVSKQLNVIN